MSKGLAHWTIRNGVRKHKALCKRWSGVLAKEIPLRSNARNPPYLDLRYLLPLAQWVMEQDGYNSHPAGNNPGNVMGSGDLGTVYLASNKEYENGKLVNRPATFASYSTLELATAAYFEQLDRKWPRAHSAVMSGGSVEEFALGLYPGPYKNYSTTPHPKYLSGLRFRLGHIITDFITIANDDSKELAEFEKGASKSQPGVSADQVHAQVELGKYLNKEIVEELEATKKRYNARQALQP